MLARLRHLAPSTGARMVRGYLVSADNRHLLLVANTRGPARTPPLAVLLGRVADPGQPRTGLDGRGQRFTLTPVGAFRAALDNESAAKGDVRRLVLFAALGIALLLVFCFSRPALGLFAFLPALAGSAVALFVFSFFHRHIFLMTLGFGGAIISITVDHGIAYLLFLDQPGETRGREAAREVWGVGLLATLTSMGAFLALLAGGFPILAQIGLFAALGIGCSFAFVHGVFPLIFPVMPPARAGRRLPLRRLIERGAGAAPNRWPRLRLFSAGDALVCPAGVFHRSETDEHRPPGDTGGRGAGVRNVGQPLRANLSHGRGRQHGGPAAVIATGSTANWKKTAGRACWRPFSSLP